LEESRITARGLRERLALEENVEGNPFCVFISRFLIYNLIVPSTDISRRDHSSDKIIIERGRR